MPFTPIEPLVPDNMTDAAAHELSKNHNDALKRQWGTFVRRTQPSEDTHGYQWDIRRTEDGNLIKVRQYPGHPGQFLVWNAQSAGGVPTNISPTGYDTAEDLRKYILDNSPGGINPLTRKPWGHDLYNAGYGQLQVDKLNIDRAHGQTVPDQRDLDELGAMKQTADQLRAVRNAYGQLDPGDMDYVKQVASKFTSLDQWQNSKDPKVQAFWKLMTNAAMLKNSGTDVTQFTNKGGGGDTGNDMARIIEGMGINPAMNVAAAAFKLANNTLSGDFKLSALANLVPTTLGYVDSALYRKAKSLTGVEGKTLLDQDYRDWGMDALKDLNSMGVKEPTDNIANTVTPLKNKTEQFEEAQEKAKQTTTGTNGAAKPDQKQPPPPPPPETDTRPAFDPNAPPGTTRPPGAPGAPAVTAETKPGPEIKAPIQKAPIQNAPAPPIQETAPIGQPMSTTGQQGSWPLKDWAENLRAWFLGPHPQTGGSLAMPERRPQSTPTGNQVFGGGMPNQPTGSGNLQQNPEGGSFETKVQPGGGNTPGLLHLLAQEHVDALQPGTPFRWQDHPHPYVKV